MSKLVWNRPEDDRFEYGTSNGVLYVKSNDGIYRTGVAWNGLIRVSMSPDGAEPVRLDADNTVYGQFRSMESCKGTIEAYTYPDEWAECEGLYETLTGIQLWQQPHRQFGFCYKTKIGNTINESGEEHYKLHLIWNALASQSGRSSKTISNSPEALNFSWDFETFPDYDEDIYGSKFVTEIIIDSSKLNSDCLLALSDLEDILYGTSETDPSLPTPERVISMFMIKTLDSIYVDTMPTNTIYNIGDTFDPSGIKVMATYLDETEEDVTASCVYSIDGGTTFETYGENTVTVSYTERGVTKTTSFNVLVCNPTIVTLRLTSQLTFSLYLKQTQPNGILVDWGDGSQKETSEDLDVQMPHTWPDQGDYEVKIITVNGATWSIGSESKGLGLIGNGSNNKADLYPQIISIVIGDSMTGFNPYSLVNSTSLTAIDIPDSVNTIGDYSFYGCTSLPSIKIPESVTRFNLYSDGYPVILGYVFGNCTSLKYVELALPSIDITGDNFSGCSALERVWIRNTVAAISDVYTNREGLFTDANSALVIYCESSEKPDGWVSYWNTTGYNTSNIFETHYGQTERPW